MNLSFNYYHKLDDVDFYLCNPDGKELCVINAYDRNVTLRFNDLSTLDFSVPPNITLSDGTVIKNTECYDLIESLRLVYAAGIGYFQITDVSENDSGASKYKTVQTESLQTTFKHKGFISEDRVYKFLDLNDPLDSDYNYLSSLPVKTPEDEERYHGLMPSVVGQLCTQLGIKIDLSQGLKEPSSPYKDWTITYVNPSLIYGGESAIARSMKANTTYGYDWMVNDVENAFKVVFIFDFLNKAIQIKAIEEITEHSNVCLSFYNFMRNIEVNENAQDITTVLSCNGDGVDITNVNPTGTNYIVDFSYYMKPGWMSDALINKINSWKKEVDTYRPSYIEQTSMLQGFYREKEELEAKIALLRKEIPDICLRTTLISGFPGETQEDHEEVWHFVNDTEFDRLGVFTYSPEEGTPAAEMEGQIPEEVKQERRDELMELQQAIAFEKAENREGDRLLVMIEGSIPEEGVYIGRTYMDAPNVDGFIFIRTEQTLMTGDFASVVVTGANEYDLIGELEDEYCK